jgi:succinoglycan biosynthesis protein ExoV
MKLYFCATAGGNFGDALNGWLWDRVLPGMWDSADGIVFTGIGTILDQGVPQAAMRVVFGSGTGYGRPVAIGHDAGWRVYGVRGPLTAQALGLPAAAAMTDPAILLADLAELRAADRQGVVFVPHWKSMPYADWHAVSGLAGLELLDPCRPSRDVVRRIASARLVIAESMHAAIIADAFRVPWVAVATSREVSAFKWTDWARSVGVTFHAFCLPQPSPLAAVRNQALRLSPHGHLRDWPADAATAFAQVDAQDEAQAADDLHRIFSRGENRPLKMAGWSLEVTLKRAARLRRRVGRLPGEDAMAERTAARLVHLARAGGVLSEDRDHARALAQCQEALDRVRRDHVAGRLLEPSRMAVRIAA